MTNTRKKSRSRSECGLLALPEELLLKILAHLRLPALASIRLVCRLLRKLSYSLITTLNTIQDDLEHLDNAVDSIVAEQLRALPSLTKLRYCGDPRNCAALLTLPGCASKLRELDIETFPRRGYDVAHDFCTKLKFATAVSRLKWRHPVNRSPLPLPEVDTLLSVALANSPQLVSLEVDCARRVPDASLCNVLQLTALERLSLRRIMWLQLLPHLAAFPCLKDIGIVPFEKRDAVERVAALTTLTRLGVGSFGHFASSPALSRLSALQALSIHSIRRDAEISMAHLVCGLTQLTEIVFASDFLDVTRLSQMLAPLHRLRHFSLELTHGTPSEFPALCSGLAGLERLSLTLHNSTALDLVPHLSHLTRLSALQVTARYNADARVPGSFLSDLTGLVDLRLHYVLSPNNARSDIPCLAMLTRLRWLVVHSMSRIRFPWQPPSDQDVVISRRDLRPLGVLWMLEGWELRKAWHWGGADPKVVNAFVGELCGICDFFTRHDLLEERRWRGSAFTFPCSYAFVD